MGKRIKLPQKPRAPEVGRPERDEDIQFEEIKPADVFDNITKKWRPGDLEDVRHMQAELFPGENPNDSPSRSLLDEVREVADQLEEAGRTQSADRIFDKLAEDDKPDPRSFWFDEDDPETITEQKDDKLDPIDMPETAHIKLEEMREQRHWTRVAAWEMPLLAQFAREFEPPAAEKPLRFRYSTYMGDFHQSESKVVLEFSPDDMPLDDAQKTKLRKLAGPRWNPEKDLIHMSCESYENQAQNKKYLSDLVDKMVETAQDPEDSFDDIPIDTRHHKVPKKPKFPAEWYMTPERKAELAEFRGRTETLDVALASTGRIADGAAKARAELGATPDINHRIEELLAGKVYKRLALATKKRN
jgi:small subunit ribosomal protein S35